MIAITTSNSMSVNAAHGRDFIWPMVVFWLICTKKPAHTFAQDLREHLDTAPSRVDVLRSAPVPGRSNIRLCLRAKMFFSPFR
jgi:hypothetical protein